MRKTDWEKAGGLRCPSCGNETVRFIGRVCLQCARTIPDELAAHLTKIGLPAIVDGTIVQAALFEHKIQVGFSTEQSLVYYQPGRQAERRLFHRLESDLKQWAKDRGLQFATRDGVD